MTCKVFVGSIPWGVESPRLAEIFSEFGTVVDSKVITDRETGRSRGFGFVTFSNESEAQRAIIGGQNMEIDERKISVNPANEQEQRTGPRPPRFNNNRSYQGQEGGYQQQQQQDSGEYDNQHQGGGEYGTYGRRGGYGGGRGGGRSNYRQDGGGAMRGNYGGYNNGGGYQNNNQRQHQYDGGYNNYGGQQQQQQPYGGGNAE
ncbi:hypothetical protein IWW38_001369 [Coemansia aciculifera]|uniref:Uncharacterized protein n=1 Tax=Coemansia aciculifera TaxID=417176 RepID=A0ACC1M769_9FUNG|nr:hypothetical protein IWW38_001369 [Coemansia aciculifera]